MSDIGAATPLTAQDWAHAYVERGWSVIPIRPHEKRPLTRWAEYQRRHTTHAEVTAWWRHWPGANIGIVTGAISKLIVVDVDRQYGGSASLADIETVRGPLPDTLIAITGGGGRHYYFAHDGQTIRNHVNVFAGIDIRADGGCVVAAPSVHPCGRSYAWIDAAAALNESPAALPAWLVDYLRWHT